MCGIVGYCGHRKLVPLLFDCLKRLEYRGYDSAGMAILAENKIKVYKQKGLVSELERRIPSGIISGVGIGHTRWATHGKPSDKNAHPFLSCNGRLALAHNGIIENYKELKELLIRKGHKFSSETDSEVLVHLIEDYCSKDSFEKAVRKALLKVKGSYAIVVIDSNKRKLIGARVESPLTIGLGNREYFLASDIPAFLKYTNKVIVLKDNEFVTLDYKSSKIEIKSLATGKLLRKEVQKISWKPTEIEKSGFEHFMLKEIFDQPRSIREAFRGRILELTPKVILEGIPEKELKKIDEIKLLGCGTSYHAALIGSYFISKLAKIRASAELASEFQYGENILTKDAIVLGISQSGETADTLSALRSAKEQGYKTLALVNVLESSLTKLSEYSIYLRCGPEICVAATKSFLNQLVVLALFAIQLGIVKGTLNLDYARDLLLEIKKLPRYVEKILAEKLSIAKIAEKLSKAPYVFFIGRAVNYPTALEGALKLKEIAYLPAEGYAAGELKHGPFALLTKNIYAIPIAVKDNTYELMLSTIGEIKAREAKVIAIGETYDTELEKYVDNVLSIPKLEPLLTPIPITVIFQLLSYYTAKLRGCEIDKPRNLAKSVTVK
jgi:glucosamine--fructose-6-phosphate aminotransferase (isomerizing)